MKTKYEQLIEPFPAEVIKWTPINKKNPKGISFSPYLKRADILDRLDNVFGYDGWSNEYVSWNNDAQLCGITVRIDNGLAITKWDGAADSDFDSTKGGLTNSFKRAAQTLGIGRYLLKITPIFLTNDKLGENGYITDNALNNYLIPHYNKEIKRLFNNQYPNNNSSSNDSLDNSVIKISYEEFSKQDKLQKLNILNSFILKNIEENLINLNDFLSHYKVKTIFELSDENIKDAFIKLKRKSEEKIKKIS